MIACLVGAALVCWRLLLLSLIVAPAAALAIRWLSKMLKRANRRAMEQMVQIFNVLEETFRGIKIVKAFTSEPYERKRFHLRSKEYYRKSMKIARYDSLSHPITEFMGILTVCLALLAGTWLVLEGRNVLAGHPPDLATAGPQLALAASMVSSSARPIRCESSPTSSAGCNAAWRPATGSSPAWTASRPSTARRIPCLVRGIGASSRSKACRSNISPARGSWTT